jgi:hypothetical protein
MLDSPDDVPFMFAKHGQKNLSFGCIFKKHVRVVTLKIVDDECVVELSLYNGRVAFEDFFVCEIFLASGS